MDLDKIQEVLSSGMPNAVKQNTILKILSEDESVLENMMKILDFERERKKALILEMNMQLSRADTFIRCPRIAESDFITGEIEKFYRDHKGQVSHCYQQTK